MPKIRSTTIISADYSNTDSIASPVTLLCGLASFSSNLLFFSCPIHPSHVWPGNEIFLLGAGKLQNESFTEITNPSISWFIPTATTTTTKVACLLDKTPCPFLPRRPNTPDNIPERECHHIRACAKNIISGPVSGHHFHNNNNRQ